MLDSGVIRDNNNPYDNLLIVVKKKDGSWKMCMDYRALNRSIMKYHYPIPLIKELFDELRDMVFSKVDLWSSYWQILMHPTFIAKIAFKTHEDYYEFLVMPFDLTNTLNLLAHHEPCFQVLS